MKIARVFYQEYPGRQIGDIHDVFPADQHPGQLLSGFIKEVEVADDFDASIMKGVVAEDGTITFEEDAQKVAAKVALDKQAQIAVAYNQMDKDIFDEMEVVFGTRRSDSAAATERTLQLMKEKPTLFSAEGLKVIVPAPGFAVGDLLDTDQLVVDYATARLARIEEYGVFRLKKMQTFVETKAQILGQ